MTESIRMILMKTLEDARKDYEEDTLYLITGDKGTSITCSKDRLSDMVHKALSCNSSITIDTYIKSDNARMNKELGN